MLPGNETWPVRKENEIRCMCGIKVNDRIQVKSWVRD